MTLLKNFFFLFLAKPILLFLMNRGFIFGMLTLLLSFLKIEDWGTTKEIWGQCTVISGEEVELCIRGAKVDTIIRTVKGSTNFKPLSTPLRLIPIVADT